MTLDVPWEPLTTSTPSLPCFPCKDVMDTCNCYNSPALVLGNFWNLQNVSDDKLWMLGIKSCQSNQQTLPLDLFLDFQWMCLLTKIQPLWRENLFHIRTPTDTLNFKNNLLCIMYLERKKPLINIAYIQIKGK